jgi:hypothetical protein
MVFYIHDSLSLAICLYKKSEFVIQFIEDEVVYSCASAFMFMRVVNVCVHLVAVVVKDFTAV